MPLLSSLSFMRPESIKQNIAAARTYKSISENIAAFEVFEILQETPGVLFEGNGRHHRVQYLHVPGLKPLLTGIMGNEFPPSFSPLSEKSFNAFKDLAMEAEYLWASDYPDDFKTYTDLVGRVIYAYRDSYAGGSVSNAIGWIWLSPEMDWKAADFRENLIHEYTHNVLFLEEMVHTLFSVPAEVMAMEENRVISSVRHTPRNFDLSYHAAAVTIVLAEHALRVGRVEDAEQLVFGLLPSLDALKEKKNLMSQHGFDLLKEMITTGLALFNTIQTGKDSIDQRETSNCFSKATIA